MTAHTKIEWTDRTWNPVTGCTKVSAGCDNCYAESIAERFRGGPAFPNGFDVQLRPNKLPEPLHWRKPAMVFVNSMSDLFHDLVPDEFIARVFAVMALAPQHTFQVLTKRHGRMRSLLGSADFVQAVADTVAFDSDLPADGGAFSVADWPLPNVWLGVSAENQRWAGIRIPVLLDTPAAVHFVSLEPLLGPIELFGDVENPGPAIVRAGYTVPTDYGTGIEYGTDDQQGLDWVIAGGESGPKARPMHPAWARSLRDQCVDAGVAFHFKQWGEWRMLADLPPELAETGVEDLVYGDYFTRVGKKRAGRVLDGRTWDEFPAVAS